MRPYVYSFFKNSGFPERPQPCRTECNTYREVARQFNMGLRNQEVKCGRKQRTCKKVKGAVDNLRQGLPVRRSDDIKYYWQAIQEVYQEIKQEYATLLNYQDNLPDNEEEAFKKILDGINKQKPNM